MILSMSFWREIFLFYVLTFPLWDIGDALFYGPEYFSRAQVRAKARQRQKQTACYYQ